MDSAKYERKQDARCEGRNVKKKKEGDKIW